MSRQSRFIQDCKIAAVLPEPSAAVLNVDAVPDSSAPAQTASAERVVLRHLVVLLTPLVVEVEIVLAHLERVLAVVVIHNPILLIAPLVVMALPISEFPKTS